MSKNQKRDWTDLLILFFLVSVTACTVPVFERIESLEVQLNERELRLLRLGK